MIKALTFRPLHIYLLSDIYVHVQSLQRASRMSCVQGIRGVAKWGWQTAPSDMKNWELEKKSGRKKREGMKKQENFLLKS